MSIPRLTESSSELMSDLQEMRELDDSVISNDTSRYNVILFGPVGVGKTSILNLITGNNFETREVGSSCTQQFQFGQSAYHQFNLIDMPGTDSCENKVKHVKIQQTTLRENSFAVVCVVCEWATRFDDYVTKLTKIKRLFRYHLPNIIVILTKCDKATDPRHIDAAILKIKNIFNGKIDVITKDINTQGEILSEQIYSCVEKRTPIAVGRGEAILESKHFRNLINDTCSDVRILDNRQAYINMFCLIYDEAYRIFNETKDRELKRALYFALVQEKDRIMDEYAADIAPFVWDTWDLSEELYIFQNNLNRKFNIFHNLVMQEIEIERNTYHMNFMAPKFKKCVCGLIWFRPEGCSRVTCGRRGRKKDYSNKKFYDYRIEWQDNKFHIEKIIGPEIEKEYGTKKKFVGLTNEEKELNKIRIAQGKCPIRPLGCGRVMFWYLMLDVTSQVMEILKEFNFDTSSKTEEIVKKHESELASVTDDSEISTEVHAPMTDSDVNREVEMTFVADTPDTIEITNSKDTNQNDVATSSGPVLLDYQEAPCVEQHFATSSGPVILDYQEAPCVEQHFATSDVQNDIGEITESSEIEITDTEATEIEISKTNQIIEIAKLINTNEIIRNDNKSKTEVILPESEFDEMCSRFVSIGKTTDKVPTEKYEDYITLSFSSVPTKIVSIV